MTPALKEAWGCTEPIEGPAVWMDDETDEKFASCPMLWISSTINEWYAEYSHIKKYPHTAQNYRTLNSKYAQAVNVYESAYDFFYTMKNPKKRKL